MEMDDFVKMKMLEREGMTPYEQFKTQHMQAKSHTSGIAVAGIVTGIHAMALDVLKDRDGVYCIRSYFGL